MNLLTRVDFYKGSHFQQYPPGMTKLYSYVETRAGGREPYIIFFGLQALLKDLEKGFTQ